MKTLRLNQIFDVDSCSVLPCMSYQAKPTTAVHANVDAHKTLNITNVEFVKCHDAIKYQCL